MLARILVLLVFCCLLRCSSGADVVQSKIISAVSDGTGWFKIVKGVPKGAILKANFTNKINATGSVRLLLIILTTHSLEHNSWFYYNLE